MTHQPPPAHRPVIEDALYDWWTDTDPSKPFEAPTVAAHIDGYLTASGYIIRKTTVPTLTSIITNTVITALVTACAIGTALHGEWLWTAAATILTGVQTRELLGDLTERRHHRKTS